MRLDRSPPSGVAVLRLEHGKANAIGLAFVAALSARLDELTVAPPRALVITGRGPIFSAGLDLPALLALPRDAMARFIHDFEQVMRRLFTVPVPVIAAINGHAIAGGCVLALQADVRVAAATPSIKLGLNEVAIGLGLPPHVLESLRAQVPASSLVPIALEGRLVAPTEALRLGLIDLVVAPDELEARALARAEALAAGSPIAFAQIKAALRAPAVAAGGRSRDDVDLWLDTWFSDDGQRALTAAVARLKR